MVGKISEDTAATTTTGAVMAGVQSGANVKVPASLFADVATYDPQGVADDAFDRANHTGTQLAATISNFSTAADARISAAIGTTVQAYSANLALWSAVAPSSYLTTASAASTYLTISTAASSYQPLDADLTAIAAVSTQAYGRGLLAYADEAAFKAGVNLEIGTDVQAYDAQLSSLIQQNSRSAAYTLVSTDSGKHIFHPSADTTARIWTIPANSSVAFSIGTVITFINQNGAGTITISITSDTLRLAGAGTTGSRTLAANGVATAIKVTSTEWIISGTGLT